MKCTSQQILLLHVFEAYSSVASGHPVPCAAVTASAYKTSPAPDGGATHSTQTPHHGSAALGSRPCTSCLWSWTQDLRYMGPLRDCFCHLAQCPPCPPALCSGSASPPHVSAAVTLNAFLLSENTMTAPCVVPVPELLTEPCVVTRTSSLPSLAWGRSSRRSW